MLVALTVNESVRVLPCPQVYKEESCSLLEWRYHPLTCSWKNSGDQHNDILYFPHNKPHRRR